jgi:hypothetical protein
VSSEVVRNEATARKTQRAVVRLWFALVSCRKEHECLNNACQEAYVLFKQQDQRASN